MICTIYVTTYKPNKKIKKILKSMYNSEYEYEYDYEKENVINPLLSSKNFHFEEWKKFIWNFDIENYDHWKFFKKSISCGFISLDNLYYYTNEDDLEKLFIHNTINSFERNYTFYKFVDEQGNIIDPKPYVKKYIEYICNKNDQRYIQIQQCINELPKIKNIIRHPHTINEKRQQLCKEDKQYLIENGLKVKERAKRKHLPTEWNDIWIASPRSWKHKTKRKHQYQ